MSPLAIETVLHVYATIEPSLNFEGIRRVLSEKLIDGPHPGNHRGVETFAQGKYSLTDRGSKMVSMLIETPLPKQRPSEWIDPREL